jgi:hypothetical protein
MREDLGDLRASAKARAVVSFLFRTPLFAPSRSHSVVWMVAHPSTPLGMTASHDAALIVGHDAALMAGAREEDRFG